MSAATTTMNGNGGDAMKPTVGPTAASKQSSQSQSLKSGKSNENVSKPASAAQPDGKERKQQQQQSAPPKAWRGPNPITSSQLRAPPNLLNGTEKPLPKLPPHAQPTKNGTELSADKHAHDRLLYLLAHLVGQDVVVTLKNGEQFSGVFSGGSFDSPAKSQYLLKMAKRTAASGSEHVNGAAGPHPTHEYVGEGEDHVMTFHIQETADLAASDIAAANGKPTQNGSVNPTSFRTDTEISSRRDVQPPRERELQRWEPTGADANVDMSLDSSTSAGWDQFATNERMYGVQSTYDEAYYTTAINRDDPKYREREAKAARIARDIEGSSADNAHVAEERTRDGDGGVEDEGEEEKYSGVKRGSNAHLPKRAAGSYVPPSHRPPTGTPTVHGAPYDPAIISSQLARPAVEKAVEPAQGSTSAEAAAQPDPVVETAVTDASVAVPTVKKPAEQTTEDHVRGTADAFKQFANNEKLRLRAAQEAKRANMKNEKNIRLNDLKKFAANFKLKSRVPDDLVPILAKDREKQMDIQQKAEEAAKEEEHVRAVEKEKVKTASPSTAPSNAPLGPSSAATTSEQRMAFFNQQQQQHKTGRMSQQVRGGVPVMLGQSPRGPGRTQQTPHRQGVPVIEPLPSNLRIPSGPALPAFAASDKQTPLSPASIMRFNATAFEFRPAASTFTPSATSPSPQSVDRPISKNEPPPSFFGTHHAKKDASSFGEMDKSYKPTEHTKKSTKYSDEQRKAMVANGGVPKPYQTPPTWDAKEVSLNTSYLYSFPTEATPSASSTTTMTSTARQPSSQGPSPLHTPNSATHPAVIPHVQHALVPHHQQQMQMHMQAGPGPQGMPPPRAPYYGVPPQSHGGAQHQHQYHPPMPPPPPFGPGMSHAGSSVHSSPRFGPAQMAAFAAPQGQFGPGNHQQAMMSVHAMGGMPMGMGMAMQPPHSSQPSSPYTMAPGLHHPNHHPQQHPQYHHAQANGHRADAYRPDLYRPDFRSAQRPGAYASAPLGPQAQHPPHFPPGAGGLAANAQQVMLLQQQHAAQHGYNQMPGMHASSPHQQQQMLQQGQQQAYSPMSHHASPHAGVMSPMNALPQHAGRPSGGSGGQMMVHSASQQGMGGYPPTPQQLQHQQQAQGYASSGPPGYQGQHMLHQHQQYQHGGHNMQFRQLSAGAGPRPQSSQPGYQAFPPQQHVQQQQHDMPAASRPQQQSQARGQAQAQDMETPPQPQPQVQKQQPAPQQEQAAPVAQPASPPAAASTEQADSEGT